MKVLYIAGTGRSGSTLIARILGAVDGFAAVGEVRYLWERGIQQDRLCGCGAAFSECPLWVRVLARSLDGEPSEEAAHSLARQQRVTRVRSLPKLLAHRDRNRLVLDELGPHADRLRRLYQAIALETSCRVVVDSSKLPLYGLLLEAIEGIELHVLHLLRDPRATAYSWSRPKHLPDRPGLSMETLTPTRSATLWSVWNSVVAGWGARHPDRYLRLRYEDVMAEPLASVEQVLAMVGERGLDLPFTTDGRVVLSPAHIVAGNPDRMHHGEIALRLDAEWASQMARRDRWTVNTLTAPWLHRYGYET
jgi:hypothetical protein